VVCKTVGKNATHFQQQQGFVRFYGEKQKDPKKHNAPRTLSIKHNQRNAESIKPCCVYTVTYLLEFVK